MKIYHEYKDVWKVKIREVKIREVKIREVMKLQHEIKNKQEKTVAAAMEVGEEVCH